MPSPVMPIVAKEKLLNIDPTNWSNLSEEQKSFEQTLLYKYLITHKQKEYFPKNKTYQIKLGQKEYKFKLANPIVHRLRARNETEDRFEIIGEQIGKGSFCDVFKSIGTLVPQEDKKLIIKTDKPRVVKQQFFQPKLRDKTIKEILNEVRITERVSYLRIKKPTFINDAAFTVLKYIPAQNLRKIFIDREKNQETGLSKVDDLLDFAIDFFRALEEQVHDNGVVHLDLKPENILVVDNATTDKKDIYIIDYNISKYKKDNDEVASGTPHYLSPEMILKANNDDYNLFTNKQTDNYSAGVILGEIFGMPNSKLQVADIIGHPNLRHTFTVETRNKNLMNDLNQDRDVEEFIRDLASKITPSNQADRMDTSEILAELENCKLERKIKTLGMQNSEEIEEKIRLANASALKVRNELKDIFNKKGNYPANKITAILNDELTKLSNVPEIAKAEFADRVGIQAIKTIPTDNDWHKNIIKLVNATYEKFNTDSQRMIEMLEVAEQLKFHYTYAPSHDDKNIAEDNKKAAAKFTKIANELDSILSKHRHYKRGIDDTIALNQYWTKAIDKYSNELDGAWNTSKKDYDSNYIGLKFNLMRSLKKYQKNHKILSFINKKDIQTVLKIMDSSNDYTSMKINLTAKCQQMQKGFFGSALSKIIQTDLKSHIKEDRVQLENLRSGVSK